MADYRIEHTTTYTYDAEVTGSYGQFHLRPRDLPWQTCLAHEIIVDPEPSDLFRHTDLYGNTQSYFHVTKPHTDPAGDRGERGAGGEGRAGPRRPGSAVGAGPAAVCGPTNRTRGRRSTSRSPRRTWRSRDGMVEYARVSFPAGRPIGEAATELMQRVNSDFTYKSGSTTTSTKVGTLLQSRTGVCQDFSHFMVSALRSLGLAGRYVSGYLATRPPVGRPRLVGADASHAWVGCWVPGAGWLYLDPTNRRVIDESHATVAWGRDYGDVPPVKGVIFTEAKKSQMKVSVDMAPAA